MRQGDDGVRAAIARRALLVAATAGGLAALASIRTRAAAASDAPGERHAALAARALAMRRAAIESGDQPYGALVARNGRVIAESPSRVLTMGDPSAHAEMEAIREAARRLGDRRLAGCVLYSSSPPCRMCETAAYFAGIERMYHGDAGTDGGRPGYGDC